MECQFERNLKFKSDVNLVSADELRSQPMGKDKLGNSYWSMTDSDLNMRIYQEHLDEDIWKVVAKNREELVQLIDCLKGNTMKMPSLVGLVDEDSSSNSMPAPPKRDALQDADDVKEEKAAIKEPPLSKTATTIKDETVEVIKEENKEVEKLKIKEFPVKSEVKEPKSGAVAVKNIKGGEEEDEEEEEEEGEEEEDEDDDEEDDEDVESNISEIDESSPAATDGECDAKPKVICFVSNLLKFIENR